MPTTAATIRDHITRLIALLVPSVLERDRFVAYRNEGDGDFVAFAQAAGAGSFRRYQVRTTGQVRPPDVSNTDVEALLLDVEILVAYPQTHRGGAQNALDRDDVMASDQVQLENAVGLNGYANFNGIGGNAPASWVNGATARAIGDGVDFLVIRQTMRYHLAL